MSNGFEIEQRGPTDRSRNILAAAATGVADFIVQTGGRPEAVFERVGIDPTCLGRKHSALDLADYVAMMEEAARETGNDNFGLRFGQRYQPHMLGLIGEIALAAPTLGSAIEHLALWFPWHQQATETRLARRDGFLRLEYRILDGSIVDRRQDAELTMGMFANVFRACLPSGWAPEIVLFEHARPTAWRDHEAAFDAEVEWSQGTNALVFRDRGLDRAMPHADLSRLQRLTSDLADVAGSRGTPAFLDLVRGEIRRRLSAGTIHLEEIADALSTTSWTLQRRLADLGATFSDLIEATRLDLARHYLRQAHLPLGDVAFLLGYSEASAFSRAFSRWTGCSPRQWRRLSRPAATPQLMSARRAAANASR
ncbi:MULTISPECIES: AraC family transcriptional regulator [unclassified Bradyrhizobium]|uniref:AraC-like transcriptional regulator QhpR n=1 Tax=unclassified Bradyrhizobium TaxID=2631580 RepID=UPI0028EDC2CE|nr:MULTISPECIES: AraC family transcriptional regulator [unclassified Bradyrhizobium]